MAEIKDKVVTVESLSALHEYDENTYMTKTNPVGSGALSINREVNTTVGNYSVAVGYNVEASGDYSFAEGIDNTSSGIASHAEGNSNTAYGNYSHAEGNGNITYGMCSHIEGNGNTAYGNYSHTEGNENSVSGMCSHAEGTQNQVYGDYSHAEGNGNVVSGAYQHVQGSYNIQDNESRYAHIVGNGDNDTMRSNAHTIDWDGNGWFAGDVYTGGTSQDDGIRLVKSTNIISIEYGDTLPEAGTVGRIFFKRLVE